MRPENAANIIAVTEDKLAIATLDRLGERQASKLLEALPAARAVQLANKLLDLPFTKKEKK
jgi:flagellar motility protein MotE (MotC chaperone)